MIDTQFWSTDESALFWPLVIYSEMVYEFSFTPDLEWAPDATILIFTTVQADAWTLEYRTTIGNLFWGEDPNLFWDGADAEFWGADGSLMAWAAWPGALARVLRQLYEFRLTTSSGPARGVVSELLLVLDLPDVIEHLDDVSILAAGTRLSLEKHFRHVKNVQLTVQDDGGTARGARVLDKDPVAGPLVQTTDAAGAGVNGLVDATVQGW